MKTFLLIFIFALPGFAAGSEESEALRALRLSCEKQRVGLGCFNYANMLIRSNRGDDSEKYYEKGCKLGHTPSCQKEKWDIPERKEANNELIPEPRKTSVPAETVSTDENETTPSFTPPAPTTKPDIDVVDEAPAPESSLSSEADPMLASDPENSPTSDSSLPSATEEPILSAESAGEPESIPQESAGTAPASINEDIAPEDIPSPESLDFSM